jgi:hypothetical protein
MRRRWPNQIGPGNLDQRRGFGSGAVAHTRRFRSGHYSVPDLFRSAGMRAFRFLIATCVAVGLSGCLSPHTVQRSPEFRGRVLDQATQEPIAHVRVAIREHQSVHTTTDARGNYRLPSKRTFQLTVAGPSSTDFFSSDIYPWDLLISRRGYQSRTIDVLKHRNLDDASNAYVAVDDIYLDPQKQ